MTEQKRPHRASIHYQTLGAFKAFYLLIAVATEIFGVGYLVENIAKTGMNDQLWGATALFASLGLLILSVGKFLLRTVSLSSSSIHIPRFIGTRRVALQNIAGIGLLYRVSMSGYCWLGFVWDSDGRRFVLPSISVGTGRIAENGQYNDLLRHKAAKEVREIYLRVLNKQGPHGALATRALQKHDRRVHIRKTDTRCVAFWSPDGEMGYFAEIEPSKRVWWRPAPPRRR